MNSTKPKRQNKSRSPVTVNKWIKPVKISVAALLLLAAGLNVVRTVFRMPLGDEWRQQFIAAMVFLGVALGVLCMVSGIFNERVSKMDLKPATFYLISAVLAAFIVIFILHYGMFQIGGYDHGYMVDLGWRLRSGQQLYKDFPCTTPISFVLGSKFALQWFGNTWRSFVTIMALYAVVSFAWSLFLLTELFGRHWTTLLWAVTIQLFSPLVVCFWTYNSTADISGVLFVLSAMYWLRRPADKAALVSYGAALLILATMKPNVAGTLILGISAILFLSQAHRWKLVLVSLIGFVLFLGFLALNHVSFGAMIASYLSVTSRGASLVPFLQDLSPFERGMALMELIAIALPAVIILSRGRKATRSPVWWIPPVAMAGGYMAFIWYFGSKPIGEAAIFIPVFMALIVGRRSLGPLSAWIPVVALLSGLYGFVTNSEQKLVDLPPVLIATVLLAAEMRSDGVLSPNAILRVPIAWQRYLVLACLVLGAVGLAEGIARDRVRIIGPLQFFEYDNSKTIADGFFKGVRCGVILDSVLKETEDVLRRNPSASVWFGPRMQWGYAVLNKPSPINEPVQWDHAMFDPRKEEVYFNNFLTNRAQILICFKNDMSGYSSEEVSRITEQYDVNQTYGWLTVLRLKK